MIRKAQLNKEISKYLAILGDALENEGLFGHHDGKIACEDLFKDLFNLIYDLQLENLNNEKDNYPAIDLGDKSIGVAYQITLEKYFYENQKVKGKVL